MFELPIEQLRRDIKETNGHVNLHFEEEVRSEDRDLEATDV